MNISLVIPTYNVQDTISQVLDAVVRQARPPEEIIIVDNNSTDRTEEKIKEFTRNNHIHSIMLYKERKKGPSPARNKGASLSKGDVMAFLDADCIPPSNWIGIIEREIAGGADVPEALM